MRGFARLAPGRAWQMDPWAVRCPAMRRADLAEPRRDRAHGSPADGRREHRSRPEAGDIGSLLENRVAAVDANRVPCVIPGL